MKNYIWNIFILIIILNSCSAERDKDNGSKQSDKEQFLIKATTHNISLPVPKDVMNVGKCMQYYMTKDNRQFLFYLGDAIDAENKILIYDLDSLRIHHYIQMMKEGPSGVGRVRSLFVHNLDSIFLTTGQMNKLFLINWKGKLKKSIPIQEFSNGDFEFPYNYISHVLYYQNAMICHDKKIFTSVHIPKLRVEPEKLKFYKTTLEIDLKTQKQKLLPMTFPMICDKRGDPLYLYFSTIFVKNKFIYSFLNSHDCLITNDHINIETKTVKSKYVKKDFKMPIFRSGNMLDIAKTILEHPSYINFMYDPYRDLIYRFVYPGVSLTNKDNLMNMNDFKPIFSIMILDTDLNILGETLMPENTYNMNMAFVGKDGLYISTNHYLNPEFDADSLKFEIFDIVKNENKK